MSTETTDLEKPKGKGSRILGALAKLIFAVILVAAGFGGGYFYFAKPFSPNEDVLALIQKPAEEVATDEGESHAEGQPEKMAKETPEQELFVTSYYTFAEPITTNLAGSKRFLQLSVGLSTQYDATVMQHVETHTLALRSDILGVLSSFTEEAASTREGRDKLAADIRDAVNARLEALEGFGGIQDVFFPAFVLQ